jgi:hypothetical protein
MNLPSKFLDVHGKRLLKAFERYGPVVQIIPDEPLGAVSNNPMALPEMTVTVITVRCINACGFVHFEAFSKADQDAAAAWAEKHQDTTREEFDWLPSFAVDR